MRSFIRQQKKPQTEKRKGGVLVLAAGLLVLIFAFAAFTVDLGLISVTKGQMQNAADASAHSAAMELQHSFGAGAPMTNADARVSAESMAAHIASEHRSGNLGTTPFDAEHDIRFGRRAWDPVDAKWDIVWDTTPYNVTEVRLRRSRENNTSLPMSFAQLLGSDDAEVKAISTAAIMPGVGFGPPAGNPNDSDDTSHTVELFPFTVDLGTWDAFMTAYTTGTWAHVGSSKGYMFCSMQNNGNSQKDDDSSSGDSGSSGPVFVDKLHYNPDTGQVEQRPDGIPELNIYPDLNSGLPPGNRGTVDLGAPNNSTKDLKRQIVHGLNAYDFSFFPNGIRLDQGPLYLNGDTGISAGIQSSLSQIIGELRAIPIFISVSGPGNNAQYLIVKFVGIRVMAAKLSGGPNKRYLYVEPAPFFSPQVIRGDTQFSSDSIMTAPIIIRNDVSADDGN